MSDIARERREIYAQPFHTGDRIRKAREHVGQDRQTFAETVGIHRETLAKYEETGKAKRSALISIAWATGVRLEWLESGELPWVNGSNDPSNDLKQTTLAPVTGIDEARIRRRGLAS